MGLIGDAVIEAARALEHENRLPRERAREALTILLDPAHLEVQLDELLPFLRGALFTD